MLCCFFKKIVSDLPRIPRIQAAHKISAMMLGMKRAAATVFPYFCWNGSMRVTYCFARMGLTKKTAPKVIQTVFVIIQNIIWQPSRHHWWLIIAIFLFLHWIWCVTAPFYHLKCIITQKDPLIFGFSVLISKKLDVYGWFWPHSPKIRLAAKAMGPRAQTSPLLGL